MLINAFKIIMFAGSVFFLEIFILPRAMESTIPIWFTGSLMLISIILWLIVVEQFSKILRKYYGL